MKSYDGLRDEMEAIQQQIVEALRLIYRTVRSFLRVIENVVSPSTACVLQNLFLLLHGSKLRFYYDKESKLFVATENATKRYFGDMNRGFNFYGRSLFTRGKNLSDSYCLENITFKKSDIVVDCGANYADLFISLDGKIQENNYITFEPGPIEYKCITKSVPNARNFNVGLSNFEGEMEFYLCSESGDSSLVQPKKYTDIVKVKVTTLDKIIASEGIDRFKLLKLEAEGWEPEILDGASESLKKCEYVAIDGGHERGVNCEATFHTLNNILLGNDFVMIDIYGPAYRALYQNTVIASEK